MTYFQTFGKFNSLATFMNHTHNILRRESTKEDNGAYTKKYLPLVEEYLAHVSGDTQKLRHEITFETTLQGDPYTFSLAYDGTAEGFCAMQELGEAICRLEDGYRDVVLLYHIEGKSNQEVVDQLSIEVSNVKTRLVRARAKLKNYLTE
jgi:RNA polymerase sigma factor (sigma-70 family)